MSNRLDENPNRVSFNPQDVDIPEFDRIAEQRGMSRAELLREQVREVVGQNQSDDDLPADETLRQAYLALLDAGGDNYRLTTESAESLLAENSAVRPRASADCSKS